MNAFDRAHACGPWRALPVPTFLADRGAGLRFQVLWAAALVLVVVVGALAATGPTHGALLEVDALHLVVRQAVPDLLLALGAAAAVARGGFDFSCATVGAIAAAVTAQTGSPVTGLAAALGCGALNGLLVGLVRIPGWLATLLSTFAFAGLAQATWFAGHPTLPLDARALGWVGPASVLALALAALAVTGAYQLLPGAPAPRVRDRAADVATYLLTGALAGVAGIRIAVELGGAVRPVLPTARWSDLVAVAALGGTFLGAGRANVVGALVAALGLRALEFVRVAAGVSAGTAEVGKLVLLAAAVGGGVAIHALAARRYARREGTSAPVAAAASPRPLRLFDRGLFHGPGRVLPVPVHLVDRRAALRMELAWSAVLLILLLAASGVLVWRLEPRLLGGVGLTVIANEAVVPLLFAVGACAVVARGGVDLSAPLVAVTAGILAAKQGAPWAGAALALAIGLTNGVLVALARAPGWLASAATAAALAGLRMAWTVRDGAVRYLAPPGLEWVRGGAWVALAIAVAGGLAWLQLAPGGDLGGPPVRWRERLGDGLPYLFSSALACVAGLYVLAEVGQGGGSLAVGVEALPAVLLAGCWLGAGRANVLGAVLAAACIVVIKLLLFAQLVEDGVVTGVLAGLSLGALVASRFVNLAAARAQARRLAAVPGEALEVR